MRVTIITCVNGEDYQNCKTKVRIDFPEDNTTRQLKMRVVDEFFPRVKSIGDFDLFYWLTVEEGDLEIFSVGADLGGGCTPPPHSEIRSTHQPKGPPCWFWFMASILGQPILIFF